MNLILGEESMVQPEVVVEQEIVEEGFHPVTKLVYDGTFGGFLTAVFIAYKEHPGSSRIEIIPVSRFQPDIFSTEEEIKHSPERAGRVWRGLVDRLGKRGAYELYASFLAETVSRERVIFSYIQEVFAAENSGGNFPSWYFHESSRMIRVWGRRVVREKERLEREVRFQRSGTGEYYGLIEPTYDILPLMIPWFRERYADQDWVIYDVKRAYGAHFDRRRIREVTLDGVEGDPRHFFGDDPAERDPLFQEIWKEYHYAADIPRRASTRLHVQPAPTRYWRYVVEKEAA